MERNYRPVSVLNTFSNTFQQISKEQSMPFDKTLSTFVAAYRKAYSTQHLLIRLVEDWKSRGSFTASACVFPFKIKSAPMHQNFTECILTSVLEIEIKILLK